MIHTVSRVVQLAAAFAVVSAVASVTSSVAVDAKGEAMAAKGECDAEGGCDEVVALQSKSAYVPSTQQPGAAPEQSAVTPFDLVSCPSAVALTTLSMTADDYDQIVGNFTEEFEKLDKKCVGMDCIIADVTGCILRFAGHDFMDYSEHGGKGSDACMDMNDPDNAGLRDCLVTGEEGTTIQSVYHKFCHFVSLADFVVIAAEAAMTYTRHLHLTNKSEAIEKGITTGGTLDFKAQFQYGRTTSQTCAENEHLPNPGLACRDVERVFIDNMGLSWKSAAALMGVHTLGRAQIKNSGFDGWWSDSFNSRRFNNNYFVSLYLKGWQPERVHSGVPEKDKYQWGYSDSNRNDERDGKQFMLDSDLCLAYGDRFAPVGYLERKANDTVNPCAWTIPNLVDKKGLSVPLFDAMDKYNDGKFCGRTLAEYQRMLPGMGGLRQREKAWRTKAAGGYRATYLPDGYANANKVFEEMRAYCCNGCKQLNKIECKKKNRADGFEEVSKDMGVTTHPTGRAAYWVMQYANDEPLWIYNFLLAWRRATTNGYGVDTLKYFTPPPKVWEGKTSCIKHPRSPGEQLCAEDPWSVGVCVHAHCKQGCSECGP